MSSILESKVSELFTKAILLRVCDTAVLGEYQDVEEYKDFGDMRKAIDNDGDIDKAFDNMTDGSKVTFIRTVKWLISNIVYGEYIDDSLDITFDKLFGNKKRDSE